MLSATAMKLDPKAQLGPVAVATTSTQPFKQLLAEARSELQHGRPATPPGLRARVQGLPQAVATTAPHPTTAQALCRARTHANGEAQRLVTTRAEGHERARAASEVRHERSEQLEARTVERMLEIIAREFSPEAAPPGAHPEVVHLPPPNVAATPAKELDPETKAAQATDLIERIELFVRSQRPGLALTLNNSLGAHVEIERVGPREIALKLVGHRGPPSAEAVSRIRDELRARGLKVLALSVA